MVWYISDWFDLCRKPSELGDNGAGDNELWTQTHIEKLTRLMYLNKRSDRWCWLSVKEQAQLPKYSSNSNLIWGAGCIPPANYLLKIVPVNFYSWDVSVYVSYPRREIELFYYFHQVCYY